jgi:hypothetical protein
MSTLITRRGTAALAVAGALLVAAFAAAPQADASTLYFCAKKKSGAVRLVSKSAKCKKSEKKLSWNTEGPAGANGINGVKGLNGVNGTNGKDGSLGKEGKEGKQGEKGTARGYAVVSNGVLFEGAHPGFSAVERTTTGTYCLVPAPGSGLDQSGATSESPGSAAAVSVDFGWSSGGEKGTVVMRQRPFGSCPAADFEVYTYSEFKLSNSIGFHIVVP